MYHGTEKILFAGATILVSWIWFILLAILGKMLGSVDKTGKYIIILNKVSSVIVLIVSCIIIKNIWHILAN